MKKLTLTMVAEKAGVGVATVDRVLNERGGVSPTTARRVLQAAREIGLKRVLPEAHQHPWQIEVILSSNDSFFFKQLEQSFGDVASAPGYRQVRLHRTLMSESAPDKLAQHIRQSAEQYDGMMVFANDHPAIHQALAACKARNLPVITLVTDLPGTERLCHVGIDQHQIGRTAGLLLDSALRTTGEVIAISGRFDYQAHRQRIEGFRQALLQRAPYLTLRETLAGGDQRDVIRQLLEQKLVGASNVVGIYNTGVGNQAIGEVLEKHRLAGRCVLITHELYSTTRQLLLKDHVAFTLDQNATQHAQLAMEIMLRHLQTGYQPDCYQDGKVEFRIVTAENA